MTAAMGGQRRGKGGMRWLRITLRTLHILGSCLVLGGHFFGASKAQVLPWLYLALASGGALILTYLSEGWLWLRELRGVAVLAKSALLLAIPLWWDARVPILIAVVVIGSYVSHMPGRYRYWVVGRGPRTD